MPTAFPSNGAELSPRKENFPMKPLQHYINVIKALRTRGIEPMVTLHHFTNPIWFS